MSLCFKQLLCYLFTDSLIQHDLQRRRRVFRFYPKSRRDIYIRLKEKFGKYLILCPTDSYIEFKNVFELPPCSSVKSCCRTIKKLDEVYIQFPVLM